MTTQQQRIFDHGSIQGPGAITLPDLLSVSMKYKMAVGDDDWREPARLLLELSHRRGVGTKPVTKSPPPKGVVATHSTAEARVRELSGAKLVSVALLNKCLVEVHPTNPGITAMRRKNALLTLVRHDVHLRWAE